MLEHISRYDVVELAAELVRQALVEIRLDEPVEAFADSLVLLDVDTGHVVAEGPGDGDPNTAIGTADVQQAPGRLVPRATSGARRATSSVESFSS